MENYQPLGQGVFHLDAHYIERGVASFYCIVEQDEVAVIETGTAYSLPYLQQFLQDMQLSPKQVRYVIPTHVHLDHAGGAGVMMREFPNAELIIHPRGARHMIDPSKLIQGTIAVYGEAKYHQLYGDIPPIDASRVVKTTHEMTLKLGDRELLVLDTPGHAYHHNCIYDAQSSGIFSGDTFGVSYTNMMCDDKRVILPTTTPVHFNPQALHQSVDMLMSYQPEQVYLTHYNVLPQPADVVEQYKRWIDVFVAATEKVNPVDESGVEALITEIEGLAHDEFGFSQEMLQNQLANDIRLDAQGLAIWFQHREQ